MVTTRPCTHASAQLSSAHLTSPGSQHLGDRFLDGKLFLDTAAFESGMRYCIDGAALTFQPADGGKDDIVFGDTPLKPAGSPPREPDWLKPPQIQARSLPT